MRRGQRMKRLKLENLCLCKTFKGFVKSIQQIGNTCDVEPFRLGKNHILFCAFSDDLTAYWVVDKGKLKDIALGYCPFSKKPEDQYRQGMSALELLMSSPGGEMKLAYSFCCPLKTKALREKQ